MEQVKKDGRNAESRRNSFAGELRAVPAASFATGALAENKKFLLAASSLAAPEEREEPRGSGTRSMAVEGGPSPAGSREARLWNRAAIGLMVVYVAVFSVLSILRHEGLRTQMNDLGNMTQAIWGAAHGDWTMRVTNDPDNEIRSRLGVHANFIFYLLAIPFMAVPALTPHMEWALLFLTSAAAGAAGLGIYCFARRHLPDRPGSAFLLGLAYWLNPMVHDANLFDFHVVTLVTAFVVWMLWAWRAGYEKTGWALFLLAMSCKEDVPAILFMLGAGEVFWGNRRRGFSMAVLSLGYMAVLFGAIIPALNFGETLPKVATGRLGWLGNGPIEVIAAVVTEPGKVLAHVMAYEQIRLPLFLYLLGGVLAVWGGMPVLVGVLPPVAVALLAQNQWMSRITGTYYWITPVALIYMATVLSLKGIASHDQPQGERVYQTALGLLFGVSLLACLVLSKTPAGLFSCPGDFRVDADYRRALKEIKELIPDSAAVSAQNNVAAHFARREMVALFPAQSQHADYLIFHLRWPGGPDPVLFLSSSPTFLLRAPVEHYMGLVEERLKSPEWKLVYFKSGFVVFERSRDGRGENVIELDLEEERRLFSESLPETKHSTARRWLYDALGYRY
jgi:uncharacterized membrane protein